MTIYELTFFSIYVIDLININTNIFLGLTAVLGGLAGNLSTVVFVRKFNPTAKTLIKFMSAVSVVALFAHISTILHCNAVDFAGVTVPYTTSPEE